MELIEDRQLAIVKLKETRYWPCQNFTRCVRVGSELLDCIACGKKREVLGLGGEGVEGKGKGKGRLFPDDL